MTLPEPIQDRRKGENSDDSYINSLGRLIEVLRGQAQLARAVRVAKVAVNADDLERLLDIVDRRKGEDGRAAWK